MSIIKFLGNGRDFSESGDVVAEFLEWRHIIAGFMDMGVDNLLIGW